MKQIEIKCKGADELSIEQLEEFQGELKDLAEEDYERLKSLITKHGFCAPIFIWQNDGTNKIMDGHQRLRTVKQMVKDGWACPKLPVDWIYADNEAAAKEILMGFVSQFGIVTSQGLYKFAFDAALSYDVLKLSYNIPNVNMEKFGQEFYDIPKPESQATFEGGEGSEWLVIVHCTNEQEQALVFEEMKGKGLQCELIT